ncbi:MAG: ABC transporter substrate-binding protein [Thaumarchaeota archaeon]|nr:ABC transporter substrate-binding protein [Nitrososphaerota archaeon]
MSSGISKTTSIIIAAVAIVAVAAAVYLTIPQPQTPIVNVKWSLSAGTDTISTFHYDAARRNGYFGRQGLNVTFFPLAGGPLSVQALTSGQTDIAYAAPGAVIGAIAGGAKIKIVASGDAGGLTYELVANEKIKTKDDLKGANWAVESIGGTSYSASVAYLNSIGLSKNDVNFVVVGFQPVRYQALIAKRVDIAAMTPDTHLDIDKYPYLRKFADYKAFSKQVPFLSFGLIATREEVLQKDPKIVESVLKALLLANRDLSKNQTMYVQVVTRNIPANRYTTDQIAYIYSLSKESLMAVNGGINTENLRKFTKHYVTVENPNAASAIKDIMDYVELGPLRNVLKDIGVIQAPWDVPDWYK